MTLRELSQSAIGFVETHSVFFRAVSLGSLAFFLITPLLAPAILIVMPPDIMVRRPVSLSAQPPASRVFHLLWRIIKNLLGLSLLLLGFILLFVPGQGLLTMFVGAMLSDLPRKRLLLQKLLARHSVRRIVERLRHKYRRAPLIYPEN